MSEPRIYLDYKYQEATIEEAIAWLTDDRIEAGDWCDQTLCDMRDAMLAMYHRLAAAEARINRSEFSVRLKSQRLYGQGFAAYINGSATEGSAVIIADLRAILESCVDSDESWKRITAESCVHELLHAFQEVFGREFNDAEIEAAIEAAKGGGA